MSSLPPLKPLHADASLSSAKLEKYRKATDRALLDSLLPGRPGSLKARPDGTIVDGHHRLNVLRERGILIDDFTPRDYPKDHRER